VQRIDVVDYHCPKLDIVVQCGKGTYIRSLARDLGAQLGCGGYIASLRRSQIGCFTEAEAMSLYVEPDEARQHLQSVARAASELPRVTLDESLATRLLHGQYIVSPIALESEDVAIFDEAGCLLAIAEAAKGCLHASKVLASRERKRPE